VSFDITLPVAPTCDIQIVGKSGEQATQAEWEDAVQQLCTRDEFIPVSPKGTSGFDLYVRYGKRPRSGEEVREYVRGDKVYDDPVFVAYNLFSLRADTVVYHPRMQTLEATGNVVADDESGECRAAWMSFKLENGKATPVR
jgi:hypothetical protein